MRLSRFGILRSALLESIPWFYRPRSKQLKAAHLVLFRNYRSVFLAMHRFIPAERFSKWMICPVIGFLTPIKQAIQAIKGRSVKLMRQEVCSAHDAIRTTFLNAMFISFSASSKHSHVYCFFLQFCLALLEKTELSIHVMTADNHGIKSPESYRLKHWENGLCIYKNRFKINVGITIRRNEIKLTLMDSASIVGAEQKTRPDRDAVRLAA